VSTTGGQANGASAGPDATIGGGSDFGPSISADGTHVAFHSIASNLVSDDTNECALSGNAQFTYYPGECPPNDTSDDAAISGDGSTIAYFTLASNLGPGDTNTCSINEQVSYTDHPGQCLDIYLRTR